MYFRITELDAQFADLQVKEQQWPLPGLNVTPCTKNILAILTNLVRTLFAPAAAVFLMTLWNSMFPIPMTFCIIGTFLKMSISLSIAASMFLIKIAFSLQAWNYTRQAYFFMSCMSQSTLHESSAL